MGKQTFNGTIKTLIILLVVFCIISMTSASAAARGSQRKDLK